MDDDVFRQSNNFVAKEGKREQLGELMVFHQTQLFGEIPLIATVPASYCVEEIVPGISLEVMGYLSESPVFLDEHHVTIRLPASESQIHDLAEFWNSYTKAQCV
jgi:hypothetical protein